jgi:hypothetical protein
MSNIQKTGLKLITLVGLGLAAVLPAAAGTFTAQNFTGDADSGISSTKTYTSAVDVNGSGETINGVNFASGSTGTNYSLVGPGNSFTGNTNNLIGNINSLDSNFYYDGTSPEVLTLTGLAPNTTYKTTFYNVAFGNDSRLIDITDGQGTAVTYNEDAPTQGNGNLLMDTFTTGPSATSFAYTFLPHGSSTDSFHQYGFSNEVVPASAPTAPQQLVTNGGFELGTANTLGGAGTPSGWGMESGGTVVGFNDQTSYAGDITPHYNSGQVTTGQNNYAAFINSNTGGGGGQQTGGTAGIGTMYQYLGTLTAGTTYTLTGLVGNRSDNTPNHGLGSIGLFTFTGVSGMPTSTLVAAGSNVTLAPASGTFAAMSFTFTATATQAGTPFGVGLNEVVDPTTGQVTSQMDFDNISVTAVAAPEPSQIAALGLGMLGLAGLALKARQRRMA